MTKTRLAGCALGALLVLGAVLWLVQVQNAEANASASGLAGSKAHAASVRDKLAEKNLAALAPTKTEAGDPFLNSGLRYTLEALLLEVGEVATPEQLKTRAMALVARYFEPALAERARALLGRYVDYRVALSSLPAPTDPRDAQSLRKAMQERQQLRKRHFSTDEYDALFASEEALDRYTVARMEIQSNASLSDAQKQAALASTQSEFTAEEIAQRQGFMAHAGVAAQTAALDAQNASPQERYRQRSEQYGDAVAQRLASNDAQERQWQDKLTQYADALALKNNGTAAQRLRQQIFSSQEDLRVDAALAVRALAAQKPTPP